MAKSKCRLKIARGRFRWNLLRFYCVNPDHGHERRYNISPDDKIVDANVLYERMIGRG